MKAFLLGLAFLSFSGVASADVLDCTVPPGKKICEHADAAKDRFGYWCRGGACAEVWSEQIVKLTRLLGSLEGANAPVVGVGPALKNKIQAVKKLAGDQSWTYSLREPFQVAMAESFTKIRSDYEKFVATIH